MDPAQTDFSQTSQADQRLARREPLLSSTITYRPYADMWYMNPSDFDGSSSRGWCSRALVVCVRDFKRKYDRDLATSSRAIRRLAFQLQRTKQALHRWPSVYLELDSLFDRIDYKITFSRGSRVHGCDEWDNSDLDDPATPRSNYDVLNDIPAGTVPSFRSYPRIPFIQQGFETMTTPPGFENMTLARRRT
jgi:hypothetical protein